MNEEKVVLAYDALDGCSIYYHIKSKIASKYHEKIDVHDLDENWVACDNTYINMKYCVGAEFFQDDIEEHYKGVVYVLINGTHDMLYTSDTSLIHSVCDYITRRELLDE